jgi:hypothetical protein
MAFLQKIRGFTQKFDPVAKWAGKKSDDLGLTPSFMYPPDPPAKPYWDPATEEGKARERNGQTPPQFEPRPRRRASAVIGSSGSGLLAKG